MVRAAAGSDVVDEHAMALLVHAKDDTPTADAEPQVPLEIAAQPFDIPGTVRIDAQSE